MSRLLIVLFVLGVAGGPATYAQSDGTESGPDSTAASEDPADWLVLPAVSYAPKTKISLGGAVGYYRNTVSGRAASSVLLSLTVTQRRQIVVDLAPELYLGQGKWRVIGTLTATRFPDSFYGIGGDTPASAKEEYTDRYGAFDLTVQRQIRPNLRVGPRVYVRGGSVTDPEAGGLIDRGQVPGATENWVVGVGGTMFWDTRDNLYYPTTGTYADLILTVHSTALGSDFTYGILETDLRAYRSLGFGVLAGQVVTHSVAGTAPFQILPKLGGSEQMRGYQSGRFRDNVHWTTQVEYRVPLFWRFKATVFASVGEVGPRIGPELVDEVERAVGVGGRLRLTDDGVHGRVDLAYSPTGIELYLSLGEAF